MRRKLKIKSIILKGSTEINVKQIIDNDDGIKFYYDENMSQYFDALKGWRETIQLQKIQVRTLENEIYTLFDCFYTVRIEKERYIHLIFNEIVIGKVDERNFKCNKLIVELKNTEILKSKDFSENIEFTVDDITIKHFINRKKYEVIISSSNIKNTNELFHYFAKYFELINFIVGYFPIIIKTTYKLNNIAYVVENEVVNKYVTDDRYRQKDFGILNNINNESFKNAYIKYCSFSKNAALQLSMYFMSMMATKSYVEIKVVNLLQTIDGLYDKLSIFENEKEEFSKEMNADIIELVKNINFDGINDKYENKIDIKQKIIDNIQRMNCITYRNKLKNMFKYREHIVFQEEQKENNYPFIKYNIFVNKCVNSRNKFSHVDEKEIYLFEEENVVYLYKLVLIIRLRVLEEIGLDKKINLSLLSGHLILINNYIKSELSQ